MVSLVLFMSHVLCNRYDARWISKTKSHNTRKWRNGGIINPLFDGLSSKYPCVLYVKPLIKVYRYLLYTVRSTVETPLTVNFLWQPFFWTAHTITLLILTCSTVQLFNLYFYLFKIWSWTDLRKNIFHDFYLLCQSSIVFVCCFLFILSIYFLLSTE